MNIAQLAFDGGFDHMMWGWGAGFFMLLFWLVLIGLLVWLVVALTRKGNGTVAPTVTRSRALDLLEERYAKGEIDREEFLQRKADLER